MEIIIFDETGNVPDNHLSLVKKLLNYAADYLQIEENAELSVTFVSSERIREINKEYRNKDAVTDVISFAIEDDDEDFWSILDTIEKDQINDTDFPRQLGDLFISFEQAQRQAEEYGHRIEREIGFLAVHGFLHLNGYDHQTIEEEKEMFKLQEIILKENGLERE